MYSNIFKGKVEECALLVHNGINVSRGTNHIIVRNKAWKPMIRSIQNGDVGYAADEAIRELSAGPSTTPLIAGINLSLLLSCPSASLGQTLVSVGSSVAFTGLAPALFGNSFLPVNPLLAWTITGIVSASFQVGRPNVQDMLVLPDPVGGITGKGAPLMSSPFLNEINSNIPSLNSVNAVPVINIYGTTKHEQPQYSIASTSLERYPSKPAAELLCEPIPIRPQFQAIDNPKDGLVPKIIYQKIAPIYISTATAARAVGLLSLALGNPAMAAYGAFLNLQWSRGDGYLYFRAQKAYQTLIGAAVAKPLVNTTIFGFRVVFFIQGRYDNLLESDAFIPEWSQKSPGAAFQFEAQKTNHFMEANHPSVRSRFNEIMNDKSFRPEFFIGVR